MKRSAVSGEFASWCREGGTWLMPRMGRWLLKSLGLGPVLPTRLLWRPGMHERWPTTRGFRALTPRRMKPTHIRLT